MARFTGRYLEHTKNLPELLTPGAVRRGLYLCQLPDFESWAASRADLTDDEVERLGASFYRFNIDAKVTASNVGVLESWLRLERDRAELEAKSASLPKTPPSREMVYIPIEQLKGRGES
jgi:hypothetical protein